MGWGGRSVHSLLLLPCSYAIAELLDTERSYIDKLKGAMQVGSKWSSVVAVTEHDSVVMLLRHRTTSAPSWGAGWRVWWVGRTSVRWPLLSLAIWRRSCTSMKGKPMMKVYIGGGVTTVFPVFTQGFPPGTGGLRPIGGPNS